MWWCVYIDDVGVSLYVVCDFFNEFIVLGDN